MKEQIESKVWTVDNPWTADEACFFVWLQVQTVKSSYACTLPPNQCALLSLSPFSVLPDLPPIHPNHAQRLCSMEKYDLLLTYDGGEVTSLKTHQMF